MPDKDDAVYVIKMKENKRYDDGYGDHKDDNVRRVDRKQDSKKIADEPWTADPEDAGEIAEE